MKLTVKGNINYSAQIVEIKNIILLENSDNIVGTNINGNHVIVSKDTKIGDLGIFFPVECSISGDFLKVNNLYRDKTLNADNTKSGFFELNGRVRCVKLRGHRSEGFFIPISSIIGFIEGYEDIEMWDIKEGISFDYIDDIKICEKYIIPNRQHSQGNGVKKGRKSKISRIVKDQFRFHQDTEQLGRNLNKFTLDTPIQISIKVHGTSAISSNILCNKKLNAFQKLLLKLGFKFVITEYDNIYSSRKVLKNDDINKTQHFYTEDIWKKGNDLLKEFIDKSMTIYYEIVGYLGDNTYIQKEFDYGCEPGKFDIYVYRITITNIDGKVYEFTPEQIQMWCKQRGLKSVIEVYKGTIRNLFRVHQDKNLDLYLQHTIYGNESIPWQENFLNLLRNDLEGGIEKRCTICKNNVPFEGWVIRKLDTLDFEAYKLKSFLFLKKETEEIDKGIENVEDNQEEIV